MKPPIVAQVPVKDRKGQLERTRELLQGDELAQPMRTLKQAREALDQTDRKAAVVRFDRDEGLFHLYEVEEKSGPFLRSPKRLDKDAAVEPAAPDLVALRVPGETFEYQQWADPYIVFADEPPLAHAGAADDFRAVTARLLKDGVLGDSVQLDGHLRNERTVLLEYFERAVTAAPSAQAVQDLASTLLGELKGLKDLSSDPSIPGSNLTPTSKHIRDRAAFYGLAKELEPLVRSIGPAVARPAGALAGEVSEVSRRVGERLEAILAQCDLGLPFSHSCRPSPFADAIAEAMCGALAEIQLSSEEIARVRSDLGGVFQSLQAAAPSDNARQILADVASRIDEHLAARVPIAVRFDALAALHPSAAPEVIQTLRGLEESAAPSPDALRQAEESLLAAARSRDEVTALQDWFSRYPSAHGVGLVDLENRAASSRRELAFAERRDALISSLPTPGWELPRPLAEELAAAFGALRTSDCDDPERAFQSSLRTAFARCADADSAERTAAAIERAGTFLAEEPELADLAKTLTTAAKTLLLTRKLELLFPGFDAEDEQSPLRTLARSLRHDTLVVAGLQKVLQRIDSPEQASALRAWLQEWHDSGLESGERCVDWGTSTINDWFEDEAADQKVRDGWQAVCRVMEQLGCAKGCRAVDVGGLTVYSAYDLPLAEGLRQDLRALLSTQTDEPRAMLDFLTRTSAGIEAALAADPVHRVIRNVLSNVLYNDLNRPAALIREQLGVPAASAGGSAADRNSATATSGSANPAAAPEVTATVDDASTDWLLLQTVSPKREP